MTRSLRLTASALLFAAVLTTACKKDPPKPAGEGATSASVAVDAAPPAPKGPSGTYKGEYTTKASSLYVPEGKDWEKVTWRGEDEKAGIGKGTIELSLGEDGRISGSTSKDGAIGETVISGTIEDGGVTATIHRKDEKDDGLSGTLEGKLAGDTIDATLKLASASAHLIREGSFKATKAK